MAHTPSSSPGTLRRLAASSGAVAALVGVLGLSACGGSTSSDGAPGGASGGVASVSAPAGSAQYRGDVLPEPVALTGAAASATFASTAGGTTTLADLQTGHLMLLYFGYTHCPDVCPTTMADLGVAVRQLPADLQRRVEVVFVTSDPDRDPVPVMSSWLGHFDGGLATPFVGLTAGLQQIDSVASALGVPLSPPQVAADGTVTVEHGAQTLAFADRRARVVWLASTTPADYVHDLRELAAS